MNYIAFLRGINVGTKTQVNMAELKKTFEAHGCRDVLTVINSGNVIFSSQESETALAKKLEAAISKRFSYEGTLVLCPHARLKKIVADCPYQDDPKKEYRVYVAFVRPPATPKQVGEETQLTKDIDFLKMGEHVLYMSTKNAGLMKSGFKKLISKPIYKQLTMRNITTVKKILALMEN